MTLDTEWLLSFLSFALATAISPGPNNLMLMAASARFGLARTVPHMLGILLGFTALLMMAALGIGSFVQTLPGAYLTMKILGTGYLLYLAFRIVTASGSLDAKEGKPLNLWEAAGFQFLNPKAWLMALGTVTTFAPKEVPPLSFALVVGGLFAIVSALSNGVWALMGRGMSRLIGTSRRLRTFNLATAALLVVSIYFVAF
jgi:threonine/homoserine/homoserine lactone efflux protein